MLDEASHSTKNRVSSLAEGLISRRAQCQYRQIARLKKQAALLEFSTLESGELAYHKGSVILRTQETSVPVVPDHLAHNARASSADGIRYRLVVL